MFSTASASSGPQGGFALFPGPLLKSEAVFLAGFTGTGIDGAVDRKLIF